MPAGLGLITGLNTALDTYQSQLDRQKQLQLQKLKIQQETMQLQYLQQQAQVGALSDKLSVAAAMGAAQPPQQPPSPYDVSPPQMRGQQQGAPQGAVPGGLPGAQPMPGNQGAPSMNRLLGGVPAGAPAPLLGGRPANAGAPQPGAQAQQQAQGFDALPPPPTLPGLIQIIAQQAQQKGLNPSDPNVRRAIVDAAQKGMPAAMESWKNSLEIVKARQAAQDREASMAMREQDHQEHEEDVRMARQQTAALAQMREGDKGGVQVIDGKPMWVEGGRARPIQVEGGGQAQSVSRVVGNNQPSQDDIKANAKAIANYEEAPPGRGSALSAKIMAEVMRQNPNYDAKTYQERQRAYTAFATGKQGDTVRSLGVADSHLQVLGDLAKGLGNNNIKLINSAAQSWAEQTGAEAPTDFDAVKAIVADEVSKAVIGAGAGTGQDRENILRPFNRANSPAQLAGAIENYRKLMGGQLNGLRRQYENSTGRKDFDKLLPSDMQGGGESATPAQSGGWSFEPVK